MSFYGKDYPQPVLDDGGGELTGAQLLDSVRAFLARFVAFPDEDALTAVTLWAAHTHALATFESTPRLALLSPEPGSGKTRAQEIIELLVPRPMFSMNISTAALFRKVSDPAGPPTILLDEADTIFGPRASSDHEDLRGFINAGHRRGAKATRCAIYGKTVVVEDFPAYAAVSLSGLDDLPDTIMTRAVVVRMRRRAPHEAVEPFRHRIHAPVGHALRDRLADWLSNYEMADFPMLPEGVEDRAADVWEPLLALADAAGGDWPERARVSAVSLVSLARGNGETLGIRLLADVRMVFGGEDKLFTEQLLEALNGMVDSPWGDLRGKPLDARGLARRLSKYGVHGKQVRIGDRSLKGYERADLVDVWARYLSDTVSDDVHIENRDTPPGYIEVEGLAADSPLSPSLRGRETSETSETPAMMLDLPDPRCSACGHPMYSATSQARGLCARCAPITATDDDRAEGVAS